MARKKSTPAPAMADAITDPAKAAAAAQSAHLPREGETRGDYLRRQRQEKGLTARQLDNLAILNPGTTQHAEEDASFFAADDHHGMWQALAQALDLPAASLLLLPAGRPAHLADALGAWNQQRATAAAAPQPEETPGTYLRRLRLARDWTMERMAEEALLSTADIEAAEADKSHDEPGIYEAIASALDLDYGDLAALIAATTQDGADTTRPDPLPGDTRSDYIRRRREAAGLTWDELADIAMIPEIMVREAEEDPTTLASGDFYDTWDAIADALDLDTDTLMALPILPAPPSPQLVAAANAAIAHLRAEAAAATPAVTAPDLSAPPAGQILHLSYASLLRSNLNPRKSFDADALRELADSIAAQGLLQNLVARPAPTIGEYIIMAGERRYRAIGLLVDAGRWPAEEPIIPVRVQSASDEEHLTLALLENLARKDVNAMEEAEGFAQLVAMNPEKWRPSTIAAQIGATARAVQQRLALVNKLDPQAQTALRDGTITYTQARHLCTAPPPRQRDTLKRILDGRLSTAADVRRHITNGMIQLSSALFDPDEYNAVAKPTEQVFEDEDGQKYFPNRDIFNQFQERALSGMVKSLQAEGWSWVDRGKDSLSGWRYETERSDDKSIAGAVLLTHSYGPPTIERGLIIKQNYREQTPEEQAAEAAAKAVREAEQATRRDAASLFMAKLSSTLRERPADMLLMLLLNQARPESHHGLFQTEPSFGRLYLPPHLIEGSDNPPLARIAPHFRTTDGASREIDFADHATMTAAAMEMLATGTAEEMITAFAAYHSRRVNIYVDNPHPTWIAYARMRGIDLPAHWLTDAQTDLVDACNAAGSDDDEDDLDPPDEDEEDDSDLDEEA